MIDTKKLLPIEIDDLVRIGRDNDGGYVYPNEYLIAVMVYYPMGSIRLVF